MSGFCWKKRAGQRVSRLARPAAFSHSDEDEDEGPDWPVPPAATRTPRPDGRPVLSTAEQAAALREQGAALAELDRFWEALHQWDEAVTLTPADAELHEMRAQALQRVNELRPAVEAAAQAARLRPGWWEAHQTLGRTLLGCGELGLARRAFSVAAHLRPDDVELRTDDLLWSCQLLERARRRRRAGGTLSPAGGVVSDEQSDELLQLLGLGMGVSAAVARCHASWPPLAEDEAAEAAAAASDASDESDDGEQVAVVQTAGAAPCDGSTVWDGVEEFDDSGDSEMAEDD